MFAAPRDAAAVAGAILAQTQPRAWRAYNGHDYGGTRAGAGGHVAMWYSVRSKLVVTL